MYKSINKTCNTNVQDIYYIYLQRYKRAILHNVTIFTILYPVQQKQAGNHASIVAVLSSGDSCKQIELNQTATALLA